MGNVRRKIVHCRSYDLCSTLYTPGGVGVVGPSLAWGEGYRCKKGSGMGRVLQQDFITDDVVTPVEEVRVVHRFQPLKEDGVPGTRAAQF